ncbi:putative clathrin assembly protein [Trifolium repens]|nr:putative clathrin assembly protein [Trifolium repens]
MVKKNDQPHKKMTWRRGKEITHVAFKSDENVKAQESSSSRSSTVQPRYLIGVQHAPQSIGGLFSELFDFELVRVIEEDQEGSMENDNEISGKKFSNSVRENISLSDRVVKLKDTLVVEDCAGLSQDIIKLYSWRKKKNIFILWFVLASHGSVNMDDKFFQMQPENALQAHDIYRRVGLQVTNASSAPDQRDSQSPYTDED